MTDKKGDASPVSRTTCMRNTYEKPIGVLTTMLNETMSSNNTSTFLLELNFTSRQSNKEYAFRKADAALREMRSSHKLPRSISSWMSNTTLIMPLKKQCAVIFVDREMRIISHFVLDEVEDSEAEIKQMVKDLEARHVEVMAEVDNMRLLAERNDAMADVICNDRDRLGQECVDLRSQVLAYKSLTETLDAEAGPNPKRSRVD